MGNEVTHDWFNRLVDDAAYFPPGNLPLVEAVPAHDAHRASDHAFVVGSFVVPDTELTALAAIVDKREQDLRISIVVTGGAGAIEPALTYAGRMRNVTVQAVESAVRDDDLVTGVRRIAAMTSQADPDLSVWVELPTLVTDTPTAPWLAALDEIAATGFGLKYRTGGPDADAYPTERQLGAVIDAALDRELASKYTAGLHNAVRHTGEDGFEHHGFVNVLAAFDAAREGAGTDDIANVLASRAGSELAARLRTRPGAAAGVRRAFASLGSCSVMEPVADLRALGLVDGLVAVSPGPQPAGDGERR